MMTQEAAATFDKHPASKLFFDYYYASGLNLYQPDRKASIERRRLDCSLWMYDALKKMLKRMHYLVVTCKLSCPHLRLL